MKKLPAILLMILPAGLLFAQTHVGLESYIDEKSHTIINYPSNWVLDHTEHLWVNYTLFPPQGDDIIYPQNLTLTHQHLTGNDLTIEKIGRINTDQLPVVAEDAKVLASARVNLNGFDTWMLEYTGILRKNNAPVRLHWKHYYFIMDGNLYTLSFICQESSMKKLGPIAKQVLESFKKVQ